MLQNGLSCTRQLKSAERSRGAQVRRECSRPPWLPWSLSVLSTPTPMPVDPAVTALRPQDRNSGLHCPALSDIDIRSRASSNFSSNIVLEAGSIILVDFLVRLQAEVAGDDFFLDLGGAAEDLQSFEILWVPPS